jgi:uncharacterized protein (DUF58 family)
MLPNEIPAELSDHRFRIIVKRLADDLMYGEDTSPYLGTGVDYVQSRPFVQGDPVKDIDWKVTARTARYHLKEYESLKSMPVYLVVDTSASMAIRSVPISKHRLATILAGGLGLAALRRLSPVGVLAVGSRQVHHTPSLSGAKIFHWLGELRHERFDESTNLAERLDQLRVTLRSRCLIVVISDLHDPDAVPAMKRCAQRHDSAVIQLRDPAETGQIGGGLFRAVEAETGRGFIAHGRSRWIDNEVGQTLRRAGVDHLLLRTDEPFIGPLRYFMASRGGLVRNAR